MQSGDEVKSRARSAVDRHACESLLAENKLLQAALDKVEVPFMFDTFRHMVGFTQPPLLNWGSGMSLYLLTYYCKLSLLSSTEVEMRLHTEDLQQSAGVVVCLHTAPRSWLLSVIVRY